MVKQSSACPTAGERSLGFDDGGDVSSGFVALSKFVIANGMTEPVKAAFRQRPHLVDGAAGYLRMEVLSPPGPPRRDLARDVLD